jgi:hypothetical protein
MFDNPISTSDRSVHTLEIERNVLNLVKNQIWRAVGQLARPVYMSLTNQYWYEQSIAKRNFKRPV